MILSISRRHCASLAVFVLGSALAACGGGDGGGGASGNDSQTPAQLTLSASTATATYPANTRALNLLFTQVTATVANPPAKPFVVIQDSGHVLGGASEAYMNADGSITANFYYDLSLAAGTYTGTFLLKLCADAGCSNTYPAKGNSVTYTLTVTQPATFSVTVNGVPTPLQQFISDQGPAAALKAGDIVSIQASQPVQWDASMGSAYADNVTSTTTSWTGTMRYGVSEPGQTGSLELDASYLPDNKFSSPLVFDVTQ